MAQRSKLMSKTANTINSSTTGASCQRPVPAWSSRSHHISQRTERFEMLLPRRPLRVQAARSLNLPDEKYHRAPTSQAQFKLEVPKWSAYFGPDTSRVVSAAVSDEKNICSVQSEFPQIQTPDRSLPADPSQQSQIDRREEMRAVPTKSSTPPPSSVSPADPEDSFLFEGPSTKRQHIETSQQTYTSKMKLKRPLRPVARPKQKRCPGPHSQAPFKIEVPKWSAYFSKDSYITIPLPSKEKKNIFHPEIKTQKEASPAQAAHPIARANYRIRGVPQVKATPFTTPQASKPVNVQRSTAPRVDPQSTAAVISQQSHRDAPGETRPKQNRVSVAVTRDGSVAQSSSQVQPAPAQTLCRNSDAQRSLFYREKVKWCVAPVIISDKFSPQDDIQVESPVPETLVIGDSILRHVQVEKQNTVVNCIPGARASHIRDKLKVLANAKRTFKRIVIHVGTNDVQSRQSEFAERNIIELCEFAKTLSNTVVFSGPLPAYRGKEKYERLMSLHDCMFHWCSWRNVGFINNWTCFWRRRELISRDGLHPSWVGAGVFSKNLTSNLNSI